MEEERRPPTQQRTQPTRGQVREGATPTRQRANPARRQGKEKEGDPPELQRAQLAHGMQ